MLIFPIINTLLTQHKVPFRLISTDSSQKSVHDSSKIYAAVSFLKDEYGVVMSIYEQNNQLDLSSLKALTDRSKLRFMSTKELEKTLKLLKREKTAKSPTNQDILLIIDESISNQNAILFVTDNPSEHIQVDIWDMQIIIENALVGGIFSRADTQKSLPGKMNKNLFEQLLKIDCLPILPSIPSQLLQLQSNPEGTVDDMVRIISHDPALTAQVLRYANSALFGFSGQIINVHDAIFRVLGYETVLYMSFGAALGRAFKLPHSGRLSMETFWKEATYRAALCQQLASRMPKHFRPPSSITYITGLLHNIGIVLMGNLFRLEFDWLNKMLSSRPEQSLTETEQNLFGCTHASVGGYVMQKWNMPGEIVIAVGEHHNENYSGEQATYVWLIQLAGQALQPQGLSDSESGIISKELCQQLELDKADVESALDAVLKEGSALESMANTLCA